MARLLKKNDDDKYGKHLFTKGNNATSVPCIARCFGFSLFMFATGGISNNDSNY
jgi:hypothetical protein